MMTRRDAIKTVTLAAGTLALAPSLLRAEQSSLPSSLTYPFKLPGLSYPFDALEPYIDAQTMQIHHDKHQGAYVENLNKALAGSDPQYQKWTLQELLTKLDEVPENIHTVVRNHGGGHYNHSLFWLMLKKNEDGKPTGDLANAIDKAFGSYQAFQQKFSEAAARVFGSGWAWLVYGDGNLEISSTPNQDNPISKKNEKKIPLLGIDVWEHAYYLKYQYRRPEYIKAFWNVINWDFVAEGYTEAGKTA
jgi:Fe-Mn family superoxide dismutase